MAATSPSAIILEARRRWPKAATAEEAQRTLILTAKQFRAGEQWPSAIKIAREGANAIQGQSAQPPRPCLVVDRLSQPVRQISNSIKNAHFGFDVLPNGQGADTETALIFKGYLRYVENRARDEAPIEWAADGAIEGGLGWFRLRTEYVHDRWDGDPNDPEIHDQELRLERITNNLTVYCDPSAMKPTRSDALYMFVTEDLDKEEFKDKYPKADLRGLEAFMATGDMTGWVSTDTIRIAEYWRVTHTTKEYTIDGKTRVMRTPKVEGFKINAVEVLKLEGGEEEKWDWLGPRIPIYPVLGEELNVDGKPILRGLIAEGMDAQRMVNYTYSGAMEIFALAPKTPWVYAAGQVENYKQIWQTLNTINWAGAPYDPVSLNGEMVPPPHRETSEPPIQAAVALMRTSEEAIKATTSTGDASLGNSHPNERSGKAIQALQSQSDLANNNYLENVRRARIDVAQDMVIIAPKITRPGQILHIMGEDDQPDQIMIGKPYTKGPNGIPQPSPENVTPEIAKLSKGLHKFYDLNAGRYAVTVSVGRADLTKRQEDASALGELIPHLPEGMAAVLMPDYVRTLSFPGAQTAASKLEKTLPPNLQPPDAQSAIPPQAQQMIMGLQQQLQQATQAIQIDQAKQQGMLQKAHIDNQAQMQIEQFKQSAQTDRELKLRQMDNAAKIEIARIGASKQGADPAAEAAEERLSTGLEQQHDATQAAFDRQHDVNMATLEHQHTLEQGAQQAAVAQESQVADQTHQQQMAAQTPEGTA